MRDTPNHAAHVSYVPAQQGDRGAIGLVHFLGPPRLANGADVLQAVRRRRRLAAAHRLRARAPRAASLCAAAAAATTAAATAGAGYDFAQHAAIQRVPAAARGDHW